MTKEIEVYLDDLMPEKRAEVVSALGGEVPCDDMPVVVIAIENSIS